MAVDNSAFLLRRAGELGPGQFLALSVLRRRKDNPDMAVAQEFVMSITVDDVKEALARLERGRAVCDALNARLYMRVDVRSHKRVAFEMAKTVVDMLGREDFKGCLRAGHHALGVARDPAAPRHFLLDIDRPYAKEEEAQLREFLARPDLRGGEPMPADEVHVLPTVNGWHVVCLPFNRALPRPHAWMDEIDIKMDADTLVYAPAGCRVCSGLGGVRGVRDGDEVVGEGEEVR